MAAGDLIAANVEADGWIIALTFEGMAPGGVYNYGLTGIDNRPSAATASVAIVSEGFSPAGVLGTINRTAYLTTLLRNPSGSGGGLQEVASGPNLVVRVAMSTYVYADDRNGGAGTSGTDPVVTVPAGWCVSGGVTSKAATLTATTASTLSYPQVIGNWSRTDRGRLSSQAVTLGVVAFGAHASQRRALACVKLTAGNGTQTASTIVTAPTVDSGYGDQRAVVEWTTSLSLAGFTDDTLITCNFVAYPWVGDQAAVLDTAALAQAETGQIPSQYYVLDVDGSRSYPMCVVDPVNGNDTTGVVYASDSPANRTSAAAAPYLTLQKALRKLFDHQNTTTGRLNAADSTVYVRTGTTLIAGGNDTATQTSSAGGVWTWTEIKPFPGDVDVTLTPSVSTTDRYLRTPGVRINGVKVTRGADDYFARAATATHRIVFDGCTIEDTRATNTYGTTTQGWGKVEMVRCTINKVLASAVTIRGCLFPLGYTFTGRNGIVIGNRYTQDISTSQAAVQGVPSQQSNDYEGGILAFNEFLTLINDAVNAFNVTSTAYTRGVAIVQNLFEFLSTSSEPGWRISSDGTTTTTRDSIIVHNTVIGQRANLFYNDEGNLSTPHLGNTVSLNMFEYFAHKGDGFTGGTTGAQGARQGGWSIDNGVRTFGNREKRGTFDQRFRGLWSYGGSDATPIDLGFVNNKSGSNAAGGNGDYHLTASSVALDLPVEQWVSTDLDGRPRAIADAAGAYAGPALAVRITAGFLGL